MSALHLYELRPDAAARGVHPAGRIVLVVAGSEVDASAAIRRALHAGDDDPRFAGSSAPLALEDLGPHDGPEEPGAVFVDGYRIAC